jgi:hypothetical protein
MKKRQIQSFNTFSAYRPLLFISILIAFFVLSLMLYPFVSRVWAASDSTDFELADSIISTAQSTPADLATVSPTVRQQARSQGQVLGESTTQLAATGKLEKILTILAVSGLVFSTLTLVIVLRNSK